MNDPDGPPRFPRTNLPRITTVAEFYAHAMAMEAEAVERYKLLAEQMEVHNNASAAAIFRKMADIEAGHRDEIVHKAGDVLAGGLPASVSWLSPEGPETADFQKVHYLMTPYHALTLARQNEESAVKFFETIAASTPDAEVKALADAYAEEERQHIARVDEWLAQNPPPPPGWDDDPDPPRYHD